MRIRIALITVLLSLGLGTTVCAEEIELVTDRPDFTESASAAPVGYLQAEMGVEASGESDVLAIGLPNLLIRTGIIDTYLEGRFEVPSVSFVRPEGGDFSTDYGTAGLGLKGVLPISDTFVVGLLPAISMPIELDRFEEQGLSLSFNLIWAWDISERFSLGGNVVASIDGLNGDEVDTTMSYTVSVAGGYSLTEKFGVFLESINFISDNGDYTPYADTGIMYLVLPNLQLDGYVGVKLDGVADGWFAGSGLSVLW